MNASRFAGALMVVGLGLGSVGCLGEKVRGEVTGTNTSLQRAIRDGSKTLHCAPKETAIAEANLKFAEDSLKMGEYYRGKHHAQVAATYTKLTIAKTDPVKCGEPTEVRKAVARVGDADGDGYDDAADKCPEEPEDFDSFEDDDGCPDRDNDGDGILDAAELVDGRWTNLDAVAGKDCRNDPEDVDGFEDEDGCPDPDNDQDGIADAADKCPDAAEDFDGFQDEDGCAEADNDADKICDPWVAQQNLSEAYAEQCTGSDQCPDQAEDYDEDQDEDGCPDRKAQFDGCSVKISDKVFFKFGKWDIDPRSFELLDDVAAVMNEVPAELHFRIEGHTDSKGSNRSNMKLSQRRADSVRDYIVGKSVAAERLEAVGYGEEQPIDTNRTRDGRARNRRVDFNVSNVDCTRTE